MPLAFAPGSHITGGGSTARNDSTRHYLQPLRRSFCNCWRAFEYTVVRFSWLVTVYGLAVSTVFEQLLFVTFALHHPDPGRAPADRKSLKFRRCSILTTSFWGVPQASGPGTFR